MHEDRFGLPLSTVSQAARDAYVAGVDSVISGVAGYREHLALALDDDPCFGLAHIALARGLLLAGEVPAARASLQRARENVAHATPREQSHVNVLGLGVEGKPVAAMEAMLVHLRSWPRDAMVLAPATSVFGLFGFSGDPDHEEKLYELLASLAPAYGQDWWFETVYGFAACETGRLDQAWNLIEHALAQRPLNAHAAHFRAHVMYERDETAASLAFLEAWMPMLDKRSLMHCHLSWHVTLAAMAAGRIEQAWQAYRDAVHPGGAWGPPLNVVTDASSFLWRAELASQARRTELWREVHAHALRSFPTAGVAFADMHTLLACIAVGDADSIDRLRKEIRQRIADNRYPPGDVVIDIVDGFAAFAQGDWVEAIRCLTHALPRVVCIGGSRAQRDLVDLTLIGACMKAGRADEARALIARRGQGRPRGGAVTALRAALPRA
jgi:tetratricopeptide (TPR) repeat protein